MRKVYADYAATTPLDPRVLEAMRPYFTEIYGNPSSINAFGIEAKRALEESRKKVAHLMNGKPDELIFTGSATEANNLTLKGFAIKEGKKKARIAISSIEHSSILNTAKWLEKQGFQITYLPVDECGLIRIRELEKALRNGISLVSIMHVNNEIGTIQPMKEIGNLCKEYSACFHTDAAQSFGKIPVDIKEMNIDFLTVNAHKIYGPKGIGALYMKKSQSIEPLLHGGKHEYGLRPSTENIPGIVGFAKAVQLREEEMDHEKNKIDHFSRQLIEDILQIEEAYLNGHPVMRLSNISSFRFSWIEGESIILALNDKGIAASTGSACSSWSLEPSHVLLALGLSAEEAHGSLRLSLGKYNTDKDIDYILESLPKVIERLRDISPLNKYQVFNNEKS